MEFIEVREKEVKLTPGRPERSLNEIILAPAI